MSTTISTPASSAGLLGSKWAVAPSETTSSSGLPASERAPKQTTNNAQPHNASSERTTIGLQARPRSAGLLHSKWAAQPPQAEPQPAPTSPIEVESTKVDTESEWAISSKPQSPSTEPENTSEPEDTREPLVELLPATTIVPYAKKSWADLVDEEEEGIVFVPEFTKENFPPQPGTAKEPTVDQKATSKENFLPTPCVFNKSIDNMSATIDENLPPRPDTTNKAIADQPETNKENLATLIEQPTTQPSEGAKPPATMLTSRWADSSYEIQGAQTRAEYRATHKSNNARRRTNTNSSSNRRRSPC